MLLALWDIDGTLVDSAGHGRYAFEDAFQSVVGKPAMRVEMAGRTDHQIALEMLGGDDRHLSSMLDELAAALDQRRERIRTEGRPYPGVQDVLAALHRRDDVVQSLLTGNIQLNAALKVEAFGLDRWLDYEIGAYGSDPHVERADLVAIARSRAAQKHGEPTGAVLIGDTPLDVAAARAAGARAVLVPTPRTRAEEVAAAPMVAPDLPAAVDLVLGAPR